MTTTRTGNRLVTTRSNRAFTMVEMMIVALMLAVLLTLAVPSWVRARETAQKSTCLENLIRIDGAKEVWALEERRDEGTVPQWSDLVGPSKAIKSPNEIRCPSGGVYSLNPVGQVPTCSIAGHSML